MLKREKVKKKNVKAKKGKRNGRKKTEKKKSKEKSWTFLTDMRAEMFEGATYSIHVYIISPCLSLLDPTRQAS